MAVDNIFHYQWPLCGVVQVSVDILCPHKYWQCSKCIDIWFIEQYPGYQIFKYVLHPTQFVPRFDIWFLGNLQLTHFTLNGRQSSLLTRLEYVYCVHPISKLTYATRCTVSRVETIFQVNSRLTCIFDLDLSVHPPSQTQVLNDQRKGISWEKKGLPTY